MDKDSKIRFEAFLRLHTKKQGDVDYAMEVVEPLFQQLERDYYQFASPRDFHGTLEGTIEGLEMATGRKGTVRFLSIEDTLDLQRLQDNETSRGSLAGILEDQIFIARGPLSDSIPIQSELRWMLRDTVTRRFSDLIAETLSHPTFDNFYHHMLVENVERSIYYFLCLQLLGKGGGNLAPLVRLLSSVLVLRYDEKKGEWFILVA